MKMKKQTILTACAVLGLATIATAAMRTDNFNNGTPAPLWRKQVDVIKVRENGRLQFRSNVTQAGEHGTLYESRGWKFDYTRNYTINLQYRLRPGQVTGNRQAAVGMIVEPSGGEVDEIVVIVQRDAGGLAVVVEISDEDDPILERRVPISTSQGMLQVRYRASADRLDVLIDGAVVTRVFNVLIGLNTGNGRAELYIGAGRRGNQFWGWNDVWLDKFKITGRIFD